MPTEVIQSIWIQYVHPPLHKKINENNILSLKYKPKYDNIYIYITSINIQSSVFNLKPGLELSYSWIRSNLFIEGYFDNRDDILGRSSFLPTSIKCGRLYSVLNLFNWNLSAEFLRAWSLISSCCYYLLSSSSMNASISVCFYWKSFLTLEKYLHYLWNTHILWDLSFQFNLKFDCCRSFTILPSMH